jgi:hypothetical protein
LLQVLSKVVHSLICCMSLDMKNCKKGTQVNNFIHFITKLRAKLSTYIVLTMSLMAAMALAHILILSGITQCRHNSVDGTDTHNHISLATLVMFQLFLHRRANKHSKISRMFPFCINRIVFFPSFCKSMCVEEMKQLGYYIGALSKMQTNRLPSGVNYCFHFRPFSL